MYDAHEARSNKPLSAQTVTWNLEQHMSGMLYCSSPAFNFPNVDGAAHRYPGRARARIGATFYESGSRGKCVAAEGVGLDAEQQHVTVR